MGTAKKDTILAVSDLQAPFHHPDALAFIAAVHKKFWINDKKSVLVNMGDELDAHALGKWTSDPDGFSAGSELDRALVFLEEYWELYPRQKVCVSNHTLRPWIKAFEAGLPRKFMKSFNEVLGAPETVKWAQNWVIDDILFEHGEGVSGPNAALNAAKRNLKKTVIGHQHSHAGVQYYDTEYSQIWGLNTGCLIDVEAYAFNYAKKLRIKPTLGMGVIVYGTPYFIPMQLDRRGKWTKKLPSL